MSKRIEELEKGCGRTFHNKKACGQRKCLHQCGDGTYICHICEGKIEERKLAEKEFLKKLERLELFRHERKIKMGGVKTRIDYFVLWKHIEKLIEELGK